MACRPAHIDPAETFGQIFHRKSGFLDRVAHLFTWREDCYQWWVDPEVIQVRVKGSPDRNSRGSETVDRGSLGHGGGGAKSQGHGEVVADRFNISI